jgi:hypothetical protein
MVIYRSLFAANKNKKQQKTTDSCERSQKKKATKFRLSAERERKKNNTHTHSFVMNDLAHQKAIPSFPFFFF